MQNRVGRVHIVRENDEAPGRRYLRRGVLLLCQRVVPFVECDGAVGVDSGVVEGPSMLRACR